MNIYGGEVQIVAIAKDPSKPDDDALRNAPDLAFDVLKLPPLDPKIIVQGDTDTYGAKRQFKEAKNSAITCELRLPSASTGAHRKVHQCQLCLTCKQVFISASLRIAASAQ